MVEIINWLNTHWGKPLTAGSITILLVILLDKLLKDWIIHSIKKLFHLDDHEQVRIYTQNQRRIEKKVDMLLHERGLIWSGVDETSASTQMNLSWYYLLLWAIRTYAKNAKKLWRVIMGKINKGILVPLISAIALFVKQVFNVEVSDEQIDMVANVVLFAIMVAGIFVHPRKKTDQVDPFLQEGGE